LFLYYQWDTLYVTLGVPSRKEVQSDTRMKEHKANKEKRRGGKGNKDDVYKQERADLLLSTETLPPDVREGRKQAENEEEEGTQRVANSKAKADRHDGERKGNNLFLPQDHAEAKR